MENQSSSSSHSSNSSGVGFAIIICVILLVFSLCIVGLCTLKTTSPSPPKIDEAPIPLRKKKKVRFHETPREEEPRVDNSGVDNSVGQERQIEGVQFKHGGTAFTDENYNQLTAESSPPDQSSQTIELPSEQMFNVAVYHKQEEPVVMFYSTNCGHCHAMLPNFQVAASRASRPYYTFNAAKSEALCKKFNIRGVPVVYKFTNTGNFEEYKGDRSVGSLVAFGERSDVF